MKLPCLFQPRILKLALTSLFSPAFTTGFPKESFEPIEQFRGRPRYDEDECIGCGACAEVCPSKCIDVIDKVADEVSTRCLVQHLDACICCGQCERYCTSEKGIKLTNEYDFVGFSAEEFEEKCEKQLLVCECGEVIAPIDQIRWLVKRLGPLAFCNPTLMLVSHSELGVVDEGLQIDREDLHRGDRIRIQCPRCRRKTSVVV